MDAMDRFVNRENIDRYRRLASDSTDVAERLRILKLLAEEVAKFKLELSRQTACPQDDARSMRHA
jgi:hypothetical protein